MMEDTEITLPRSVVAALVDPSKKPWRDGHGFCVHCAHWFDVDEYGDDHADDCPVGIVQEALEHQ